VVVEAWRIGNKALHWVGIGNGPFPLPPKNVTDMKKEKAKTDANGF